MSCCNCERTERAAQREIDLLNKEIDALCRQQDGLQSFSWRDPETQLPRKARADDLLVLIRRCLRLAREHRDFSVLSFDPFWEAIGGVEGLATPRWPGPSVVKTRAELEAMEAEDAE